MRDVILLYLVLCPVGYVSDTVAESPSFFCGTRMVTAGSVWHDAGDNCGW